METTVLSVGKSVLNGAVRYAQSAIAEEVALQLGVRRDQVFITNELEMMQAFLMAANDEGDGDSKVVRVWVKQVRDLAYDVEDSLQDFAVRLEKQPWWRILLKDRRQVAKQMKGLRANVEDVSQRNMRYHLIKGSAGSNPASTDGQSAITGAMTMSSTEDARRQREKAKADLVQLIRKMDDRLRVIAVWGTSTDVGETSVIKRAFEDLKKHNRFDCHAWIKVMCPFNSVEFMRSIIRQFYINLLQDPVENMDAQVLRGMGMKKENDLVDEFKSYLNDKSYLIVIDGMSTTEEWDQIKPCFPNNKRGSRIIVSTKQVEVASLCAGPQNVAPEHKQLSIDQNTLYAFFEKGSQDGDSTEVGSSSTNSTTTASHILVNNKILTRMETTLAAFKEFQLIGREKEKSEIIQLVTNGDGCQFEVISVCGMGGLGKTTVVRDVYQSQELRGKFEKCACVTIMRPFNCDELLKNLAGQFGYEDVADMVRHLEGKKCLIVLDDLSSTREWDAIIPHFTALETSSRIIVTTRVEDIGKHCSKKRKNIYKLQGLELNDAHDLFIQKVFDKTMDLDEQYPELVEQTNMILKKCKGLPLAIVTIGGFLANQPKTALEWKKLNEHISAAELQMNPELEAIITVLNKSYDGLPYHLKSCFLYLSIFPEDYNIKLKRLLRRWIAEGYPGVVRNKSTEEVAESYFMDLISRSMLLPSQRSICDGKRIGSCQVHDLIREIGISKSMEGNLVLRLEEGCSLNTQGTARHLAISSNWERDQSAFESIVDMSRVRSITVFGEWKPFFLSDKMRLLRVLDLEDTTGLVNHHLEHIGKFLHLRYLSLRGCESICHLPDTLGNLRQLETLDIRGTSIVMLPQTIIKLQKLQHLHAGFPTKGNYLCTRHLLHTYGFNQLDACTSLCCGAATPCIMMDKDYGGGVLPGGARKLKSLHTIRGVHVAYGDAVIQEIGRLSGLRKLGVMGINEKNDVKFCSAISNLSRLESLSVQSDKGCLDDITSPPKNLRSLKLEGRLGVLPEWIKKLQNLVKLKLSFTTSSQAEQDAAMEVLGHLPNLSILRLPGCSFKGGELHFQKDAFRSIVVFDVEGLGGIKSVNFDQGAMPELEQLKVTDACKRGGIGFFGLDILPSIKEVLLSVHFKMDRAGTELEREARLKEQFRTQLARNPKKPILKME
uniref:Resistance protein RGA2 n=1 Tax=Triticum turgidum subsp. durum TaxID=4567 RepID=B4YSV1_TRITD|nr:resistance protein RGA2 [Triticum turgidum subsp. durum]